MRKAAFVSVLIGLCLSIPFTVSFSQTTNLAASTSSYRGDIDENGKVDIFDLLEMLKMLGSQQVHTERKRQISDMDTNGKTDIFDLLGLLKVLGGRQQPEVIYWGPVITGLSHPIAAGGDTLAAYLENIDETITSADIKAQIDEQDVDIHSFTVDSVKIIIPQWFAGGQLRLLVAADTSNSVLTLLYIPGLVNSTSDSGTGSLRHAITNASPGDSITFDPSVFPPCSPDTIVLVTPLPELVQGNLVIDASDAGVVIDGSMISEAEANGIYISSSNNVIRGLHLKDFSSTGIALHGGAQNNTIGGDPNFGEGPSGQGNIITCTVYSENCGIRVYGIGTSFNTIQGNFIGTDAGGTTSQGRFNHSISIEADDNLIEDNLIGGYQVSGVSILGVSDGHNTVRGNYIGTDTSGVIKISLSDWYGVSIDNSGYNAVGPSNVIAHNGKSGIIIQGEESVGNRITQNSIFNNGGLGFDLSYGGNNHLAAPALFDFDLQAGTLTGVACANCTVEVFSDSIDEGEVYEGQATADDSGLFTFSKGAPFTRSRLTATATDTYGNTSQFSVPTPDSPSRTVVLQDGNNLAKARLQAKNSGELIDNFISGGNDLPWILDLGVKRAGISINEMEWSGVRWNRPEFVVRPSLDYFVTTLAANGVKILNQMCFWDKADHPWGEGWPATDGWQPEDGYSRFQTDEEIERYIEFVRFNVQHFKDRIQYYEFWNEPDNGGFPVQYIKVPDYINLVKRVAPVIREEYPEAKIVFGSITLLHAQDYFFELLRSDEIMPLVDVLSWHPLFGSSPEYDRDYYYDYPSIVQAIKDTAAAHGFKGEYTAEAGWSSERFSAPDQPVYTEIQCAKYYARAIVMHRSMDIITEAGGLIPERVTPFATVRNLCTVMAGTTTDSVAIQIQSDADSLRSCSFSLPDGDKMVVVWTDGIAVDDDPGVAATVTIPWPSVQSVIGIDVLNGFEQELIAETENGNLVIRGLLVKDYPIFISIK